MRGRDLVLTLALATAGAATAAAPDDPAAAAPAAPGAAEPVRICVESNDWLPFVYWDRERQEVEGVHVDETREALGRVGRRASFERLPWLRCLELAGAGQFDAVVSASFSPARAQTLDYPDDAATGTSRWRLSDVEYVLVSHRDDPYVFDGNWSTIPRPARVPKGYSIIADLEEAGVEVDAAPGDRNNFLKLVRDRRGVVVSTRRSAEAYNEAGRTAGLLQIHDHPLVTKSYFLAFSRQSAIPRPERQRVWDAIRDVRNDAALIEQFYARHRAVLGEAALD